MIVNIFVFIVVFLSGVACITDLRGLKIPNIIPALIMVLFVIYAGYKITGGTDYHSFSGNIVAGVSIFILTFILFGLKMFGAGDAKLATSIAFWVGISGLPAFLLFMTFSGGILGIVTLVLLKTKIPEKFPRGWFKFLADGRPDIPYAVAIFIGCIAGFAQLFPI